MREAYISDAERNGAAVAAVRDHLHWAISTSQELSVSYHGWRDLLDPAWEPWAETWQRFAGADALAAATKIVDRLLAEHGEPEDSGSADEDADLLDELDALAPLAQWKWAEELAAQALRSCGYEDAECTPPGADGGLDVLGARIAAQVKWVNKPISRPIVQQLHGASGARAAAFFARSGYTNQAIDFADSVDMALFTIAFPRTVTAVNDIASAMTSRVSEG